MLKYILEYLVVGFITNAICTKEPDITKRILNILF